MNRIRLSVILAAVASLISTSVVANTGSSGVSQQEIGMPYAGGSQRGLLVLPVFTPGQIEEMQRRGGGFQTAAPARGVGYFQVYAVGSSNGGWWEYVSASQLSTINNHGGTMLRVAVLQYGYGNGGASLNGAQGSNYLTEYLCGTLSTLHYCGVGESITGFMLYYSFDGSQGGNFSAYTNSIAYPWGQRTDQINIL